MLEVIFGKNSETKEKPIENDQQNHSLAEEQVIGNEAFLPEAKYEKTDEATLKFRRILQEKQKQMAQERKKYKKAGKLAGTAAVFFLGGMASASKMMQSYPEKVSKENTVLTMGEEIIVEDLSGDIQDILGETNLEENPEPEKVQEEKNMEEEQEPPAETEENFEQEEAVREETGAEVQEQEPENYVVQAGDTLAGICRNKYGNLERLEEICLKNGITDGDYICEGEIILLP